MTRLEAFKYQSRVVAFIDVLGFKQLVNESDKSPLKRDKVAKLVETNRVLEQYAEKLLTSELAAATFFSDSFVISAKCDNAIFLIREVVYLCRRLLVLGLPPCRGAITVGSLYHRERIAVGPALVAAYEMETSTAVYPRVILDK